VRAVSKNRPKTSHFTEKNIQKRNSEIFREILFQIFLAIVVPQPIWGMPENLGGLGPLVWEEIVVNPKLI
jgi:hypothetical protein